MTWILLVTWIIPGQPPQTSSYQTQFNSQTACAAARDQVLASAVTLRQQMMSEAAATNEVGMQTWATMRLPHVSAVCSAQ